MSITISHLGSITVSPMLALVIALAVLFLASRKRR